MRPRRPRQCDGHGQHETSAVCEKFAADTFCESQKLSLADRASSTLRASIRSASARLCPAAINPGIVPWYAAPRSSENAPRVSTH